MSWYWWLAIGVVGTIIVLIILDLRWWNKMMKPTEEKKDCFGHPADALPRDSKTKSGTVASQFRCSNGTWIKV